MFGAIPTTTGRELVRDAARVATRVLDDAPTTGSATDGLRELLLGAGVWEPSVDQALEAVRSHPTPDAVRGAIESMIRADTFHSQIVPRAIDAVDSGRLPQLTAAIDRLATQGVTGNGLTTQLLEVAGHPRFDEIVELAPLVRKVGTYAHYTVGTARDAVDSGQAGRVRSALHSVLDAGIDDGSIAMHLVEEIDHPRFDEVLRTAIDYHRSTGNGHQAVRLAKETVEAGTAERIGGIVRALRAQDIGNSEMLNQLVELARDPRLDDIVELVPTVHRVVPNGYEVVPMATRVLESGRAADIARIANELADDGIAYKGLIEQLQPVLDHPQRDRILEVARTVRNSGAVAHVLDKARLLVESPRSEDAIDALRIITESTGPSAYASYVAADLVHHRVSLDEIRLALDLGVGRINRASIDAVLRSSELEATGLGGLGRYLGSLAPTQLDEQREVLAAMLRRLDELTPVDETDRTLLEQLQTLTSDNFQRLAGTKVDGYRGYPEYAELGRIDATIRLRELRARIAEAAADSSEQLRW